MCHGHQYAVTAPVARLGLDSVARDDILGSRRRALVALVLLSVRRRHLLIHRRARKLSRLTSIYN